MQCFDPSRPFDVRIAVNRAAIWFAADWWAANDSPFIRAAADLVAGNPKLFTRRENRIDAAAYFDDVYPFPNEAQSYFTMPGAMALAAHLGATRVEIFGCDWAAGQSGLGGADHIEADRSAARFAREREHYDQITAWLNEKGIEVTRHGLDGRG